MRPQRRTIVPIVRFDDPMDAFIERQQILMLRPQEGGLPAEDEAGGAARGSSGASRPASTRGAILEGLRSPHLRSPPPQRPQASGLLQGAGASAGDGDPLACVYRGLAALPASLGVPPADWAEAERRFAALTGADIQAIFEPPGLHLLQVLCPVEVAGLGGAAAPAAVGEVGAAAQPPPGRGEGGGASLTGKHGAAAAAAAAAAEEEKDVGQWSPLLGTEGLTWTPQSGLGSNDMAGWN